MLARTPRQRKIPGWPRPDEGLAGSRAPEKENLASPAPGFQVGFLSGARELRAAERLRHRVLGLEYGDRTSGPPGLDRDRFDRHCLHLGVCEQRYGTLAGYTRILPDDRLGAAGGFYAADEFELDTVNPLPGRVAELGRTCIHPDYRGGAVMGMLGARLAQELQARDIRFVLGCASVPLNGPGDPAAIMEQMRRRHRVAPAGRVRPHRRAPVSERVQGRVVLPPLLKTYLHMGAQVCGEPCWDPGFRCLDFLMLLDLEALPERYTRRFRRPLEQAV